MNRIIETIIVTFSYTKNESNKLLVIYLLYKFEKLIVVL